MNGAPIGTPRIAPFGELPVDSRFEYFAVESPVGPLTAFGIPATGPSRGTALFVPGFTGSKEDFRHLLPLVADLGWDAVAYSQRGQADSAASDEPEDYRLELVAADAVRVAGALAVEAPIHLVGHSLGGLVARAALLQAPDRFADLTMLCSGPFGRAGRHQENADFVREHGLVAFSERDSPALETLDPKGDAAFERARFAASSPANYLGGVRVLQETPDSSADVAATGVPVMVAHGDTDDAWPIDVQRAMAGRMRARYEVIPNAGHLPNIDNPDYTARILSDFWLAQA